MNINNWKIFNKTGSNLNWTPDPYINLIFNSITGINAEGFLITDTSGFVTRAKITDGGYFYNNEDTVSYVYAFDTAVTNMPAEDVSIVLKDVSIFNPEPTNTKSIDYMVLDMDASFVYPSVTYAAAIFLEPVSKGLIETEHLFILEEIATDTYIRPYDASNFTLVFRMIGGDSEIQFFTVNENQSEIIWTNELVFDTSIYQTSTPITINIGFRAEEEGVYERIIRIYHSVDNVLYALGDIAVSAEAIGEDERFRTLLTNFGLPDPKDFPTLFKEADINEDIPDWQILNPKSKHMILEHDKIMPYVGTYKALINALKWLGYDDIYVREWFKNVKENKKLSFIVPFEARDRTQTILMFNEDQRKILKKLNELSLVYCLTRETGELDIYGTPITENCYPYNIKEIFIKLLALKQWLERYIIGINCRIVDITGEGVYYERVQNLVYSTDNIGYNVNIAEHLTPYGIDGNSELAKGDASARLTLLELTNKTVNDFPYRFSDTVHYAWSPIDPCIYNVYSLEDPSYLADPSSFLLVGATFEYPFAHLSDIMWKFSVEKDYAGVVGKSFVTNPLFIYENELRFYNIFDTSTIFHEASTNLSILMERGFLRDISIDDEWVNSIAYSIYPNSRLYLDASSSKTLISKGTYSILGGTGIIYTTYMRNSSTTTYDATYDPVYFEVDASTTIITITNTIITIPDSNNYFMESSLGVVYSFNGYVVFEPDTGSHLQYAVDDNYHVPLLTMSNYKCTDASGNTLSFVGRNYYLDILDGKIAMNGKIVPDTSNNHMVYINFHYDTSLDEQSITMNVEYYSPRMKLWQVDASRYYWADPSGYTGNNDPSVMMIDNSIYVMDVNHIGDYNIEIFGWDTFNTMFYNPGREQYPIWTKRPTVYTLVDSCTLLYRDASRFMTMEEVNQLTLENRYPIYDRYYPLQSLQFKVDTNGRPYVSVPSITYFQDVPEVNSLNKFYNLTERVLTISGNNITVDNDFQMFYTGDYVNIVKYDKGKYSLIEEVSSYIVTASGTEPISITLDQIPATFDIDDPSTSIYILNDTYRTTVNVYNTSTNLVMDISGYEFEENQLVGIIVTNASMGGYSWGASYRVVSVDGSTHTFDYILPQFFIDSSDKYTIYTKHAFSTYSEMMMPTQSAYETGNLLTGNEFNIYLKNSYCQEHYLDNTFNFMNVLFDQHRVNSLWYDPSMNLIQAPFYYYNRFINIDTCTFIILRAEYDPSDYMLDQRNIWKVTEYVNNEVLFKVFNKSVPFIFDPSGFYTIECESYDRYGNLISSE